ncbi:MAG: nickel-type superoxide dismutase maturation protease [Bradymonadia bacterium]
MSPRDLLAWLIGRRLRLRVAGDSMRPALKPGDFVFAKNKLDTGWMPRVGDIVVCRHPYQDRLLIKRVTRLVGERVVVEGDNPIESTDSRSFGPIPRSAIVGLVTARI